jgi:Family of unknown function (DUF5670)
MNAFLSRAAGFRYVLALHTEAVKCALSVGREVKTEIPARVIGPAQVSAGHRRKRMLLALFIILLIAWLLGFLVFHVSSFLIHVLLIVAVIALIFHFVRGAGTP